MISARQHAAALALLLRQDPVASAQIKDNLPFTELLELLGLTTPVNQMLAEVAKKSDVRVDIGLTPEKVILFEIDGKPIVKLAPADALRLAENLRSAADLSGFRVSPPLEPERAILFEIDGHGKIVRDEEAG
jgi:hypothetical protein